MLTPDDPGQPQHQPETAQLHVGQPKVTQVNLKPEIGGPETLLTNIIIVTYSHKTSHIDMRVLILMREKNLQVDGTSHIDVKVLMLT